MLGESRGPDLQPEDGSGARVNLPGSRVTDALTAPVRMVVGFVVGGAVALLAFGLSWSSFWPSGFESFAEFLVLLAAVGFIGAGFGATLYATRPLHRWYQLGLLVLLGAALGAWVGRELQDVLLADCLRGTGPQERWCADEYSFVGLMASSAVAGGLTLAALAGLGVNVRSLVGRGDTR